MRPSLCFAMACAFGGSGCQNGNSNGELFNVTSTLSTSTCGAAVTVEDSEKYQVRITRSDEILKWYEVDTGDSIQGSVSSNEFTLAEIEFYQVTEAAALDPGCAVRRHDSYSGTLTTSGDRITKVEGAVVSTYAEATGYSCDVLIGATGGFSDLPCEVKYTFVGTPAK